MVQIFSNRTQTLGYYVVHSGPNRVNRTRAYGYIGSPTVLAGDQIL